MFRTRSKIVEYTITLVVFLVVSPPFCPQLASKHALLTATASSEKTMGVGRMRTEDPDELVEVEEGLAGTGKVITGGKRWCPGLVHHKYIARKWTKYQPHTHPVHCKSIQNVPSQFSCSVPGSGNVWYIHSVPSHVTRVSPSGTPQEHPKYPNKCNHDVPEWLIWNVLCDVPSSGTTVFPVSKTENEPERCAGSVPEWHILNVLKIPPMVHHFRKFSGKLWGNTGNILNVPGFPVSWTFPCSVPRVSPKISKSGAPWAEF